MLSARRFVTIFLLNGRTNALDIFEIRLYTAKVCMLGLLICSPADSY